MAQDSVNITFHVNMNQYSTSADGVYLAGGGTFGNPGDNLMDDSDGDDIWSITVRRPRKESSDYTFTNGNCADYSCKEDIAGQMCAVAPFNDRRYELVDADTVILTCFGECTTDTAGCSPVAAPVNVTFRVDMSARSADSVTATGNWAGWGNTAVLMDDSDGDDIWEGVAQINANSAIEFKFVEWTGGTDDYELLDTLDGQSCVMNFGGFVNRVATIGAADEVLCVAPYGRCCQDAGPYDVEFSVDVSSMSPAPTAVNLGANWDGWSGAITLADQGNGIWSTTVSLAPGPIEYKFITDGTWETLDSLDGQPCVMNFGGFVNRVDTVTDNAVLCTPVIGECCAATGINDLLVNNNLFVLRPTLASDFAYLDFPELRGESAQLQVINAIGQVVLREDIRTNGTHRLDVRSYSQGLYFVQVKVGNTIGTQKMIVD